MRSFGPLVQGSVLERRDDGAIFTVVFRALDRVYVQRTLCIREFSTWFRSLSGGRLGGITFDDVTIGEKVICTAHNGSRFVVLAKDDEVREIIVAEGIVAKDPACWGPRIGQ